MNRDNLKKLAKAVLTTEAQAVAALVDRIDNDFIHACELLLACEGRIVVTGIGKSGHIAKKLTATFASTGSPAFFLHAAEASHGDLGMITTKDVVVAISNSGETQEIITLLPMIKRLFVPLIAMTGNPRSTMAREATVNINVSVEKEACPLGLAPTASTTATLAMGDALAIALLESRGFTEADFAQSHPGGILGRRLLLRVEDLMRKGDQIPKVSRETSLADALLTITRKGLGITTVVDPQNRLEGIFTDGDLRRTLDHPVDMRSTPIHSVMTRHGKTIPAQMLAVEALNQMETHKIMVLVVTNDQDEVTGILHMHDLLRAGVV